MDVDYISSGHHHCRDGWLQLRLCPYCNSQNYHLGFNVSLGFFACWRCGGHHVIGVLRRLGLSEAQAQEFYKGREFQPYREKKRTGLVEPKHKGPLLSCHKDYLRGRGFDPAEIESIWQIEGIGRTLKLSWRIYIPIIHQTQRVSWTTRAIGERVHQRYVSAAANEEAINHKHLCYGLDYCLHSVVICEGPFDVWRIGPGAAALFGTAFSNAQVGLLARIPHRFIVFDNSKPAQRHAEKLAHQLACFPGTTQNLQIDAKDPGSAPEKEVKLIRKIARLV